MPASTLSKYIRVLVNSGFDALQVLKCGRIKDLQSASVTRGHALQLLHSWDSSSSCGSSSRDGIRIVISSEDHASAEEGGARKQ